MAAILITDVVGYSRMVSEDEEGTLRCLEELRRDVIDDRVTAAGGRIVKSTGDGVLAEFGSSVRAVKCAVAIQRAASVFKSAQTEGQETTAREPLRMRIGINLGDVIVQPDGDLMGDGVNVAARLEPLAEPGGLCISRSVHEQVRDRLPYPFEDGGERALKNISRPVGTFMLSAAAILALPEDKDFTPPPKESKSSPQLAAPLSALDKTPSARNTSLVVGVGGALLIAVAAGLFWYFSDKPKGNIIVTSASYEAHWGGSCSMYDRVWRACNNIQSCNFSCDNDHSGCGDPNKGAPKRCVIDYYCDKDPNSKKKITFEEDQNHTKSISCLN